jgi:hypothetical protein
MRLGGDRDESDAIADGGACVQAGTVSVRATTQGLDASSTGPLANSSPAVAARSPSSDVVLAVEHVPSGGSTSPASSARRWGSERRLAAWSEHETGGCADDACPWPYPGVGEWAEPALYHATELMRSVASDPAAARGARAASDLWARHDPVAVGPVLAEHVARRADWAGKVGS